MKNSILYIIGLIQLNVSINSCDITQTYDGHAESEKKATAIVEDYFREVKNNKVQNIAQLYSATSPGMTDEEFVEFNKNYLAKSGALLNYNIEDISSKVTISKGDTTGYVKITVNAQHANFEIIEEFAFKYVENKLEFYNLALYQNKLMEGNTQQSNSSDTIR
jgi:hypothetical protein